MRAGKKGARGTKGVLIEDCFGVLLEKFPIEAE